MDQNNQSQTPSPAAAPKTQGGSGISENTANLFCYLGFWISGLVFFLTEKDRPTVRFHAAQSIIVFGGLQILSYILNNILHFYVLSDIIYLILVVLWVFLMYKGYQGGIYKLPQIGDIAEKIAKTQ
ncbi:MAG: hypothetical protein V1856_01880 [Candidatus Liptonbacteria bacterium]